MVQLILKLTLIFEHSQLKTKRVLDSKHIQNNLERLLDAPTCKKGILIEESKAQSTKSRWL